MFCFIGSEGGINYISLQKLQFNNADITQDNSYTKIASSPQNEQFKVHSSATITCFEITRYNLIQCFYLNANGNYEVGLFKEDTLDFIDSEIIDEALQEITGTEIVEIFHRSINLKNEISILAYMLNKQPESIFIQIKNLIYNNYNLNYEFEDYLIRFTKIEVKIEGETKFNSFYYLSDLKKINANKFALISSYDYESEQAFDLYIILFDIYNFHDTNLFIRYYYIQMKLYNFRLYRFLLSINYNGFLGLIYTIKTLDTNSNYQKFSIFSYINSTDSTLITLETNTILQLRDYINNENIENNIFGIDLYGVKILKLPNSNEIGVYFLSKLENKIIFENDILQPEDEIYFVYDFENLNNINEKYTIEMGGIIQEKTYSNSLDFTIHNKFYGNASYELFYKRKIFIGRTSFYNFSIPNSLTGSNIKSCKDNCKVCYNDICIKCENDYKLVEDANICQMEFPNINYYLDENFNMYKKCHENCKTCSHGPIYYNDILEIEDTNCDECIDDYYRVENTNNCINKNNIPETFYFDSNKQLICKCFENCKTCNQDKINSTYYSCLTCDENSILYEKSGNCLNCYARGKYANHYENECIDSIPEGYYLEDEQTKAIEKCYFTCKKCEVGGDSNDHKCTECGEDYPYKNKEGTKCLEDCSNEYLYTDLQTKMCYNDCIDNIVTERIYNYKNICYSIDDLSDNLETDGNNFIRKCNNLTDFYFNNECYESCPNNTKINESSTIPKLCICNNLFYLYETKQICIDNDTCPIEYPYLKPGTSECSKCYYKYKGVCYLSCPNNTYVNQTIDELNLCVDIIIESVTEIKIETENIEDDNFFNFLKYLDKIKILDNNNNLVISDYSDITINIYMNGIDIDEIDENYSNLTFINLEECGEKLKLFYNLDSNEKLYIVSFERLNNIENRVTNQSQFEIYLKNGTQLNDLSVCNNSLISVYSAITNLDLINYEEAKIFSMQGYNIYNLSSEFYTDKCSSANINGNDIVLNDRIEEIYPYNASFCPNGCGLDTVKIESKRVKCSCNISYSEEKVEITDNQTKINDDDDNFLTYLLDSLNYKIFGCYKIILSLHFKDLVTNAGFYFGAIIILFKIISCFIFSYYFLKQIRLQIYKSIPNNKNLLKRLERKTKTNIPNKYILSENEKINDMEIKETLSNDKIDSAVVLMRRKRKGTKRKTSKRYKRNLRENNIKNSNEDLNTQQKYEVITNVEQIEEKDYNNLPYTQALNLDKRNFFSLYLSLIKMKIDIISILFYPDDFTHQSLTLSIYIFDFLFSFFMNALLYTDDVVSEKYHNNGQLDYLTSLFLSLASNIIFSFIMNFIKKLDSYEEYLSVLVKDIGKEYEYILIFKKLFLVLKIKVFFFYIISFILSIFFSLYLIIFCQIYKKSQVSLIENYAMGFIESLVYSVGVSLIICILRYIGLRLRLIHIYRTSVYLDVNL